MQDLSDPEISDVIHMALSDHIAFSDIKEQYGLSESDVKKLMRKSLKSGSYRAWRKRVSRFSERRAHYK
ncbi:MAG: TIGR03643 family protein [Paracoccaceae bacterium]